MTCGEQDDDDFTAADLCCACGGGLDEAPEPVVLAVSLTVEMDCAECALKGGGRARARARETTPCCWGGRYERARQRPPPPMGNDSDRESRKARRDVLTFAARARARVSPFADGSDEQAVFAAAMEATIPGASVEAGDCTQLSRRRNLLQTNEASLAFTVTVSGTAALTATANSITSVVNDAVNSRLFHGRARGPQRTISAWTILPRRP